MIKDIDKNKLAHYKGLHKYINESFYDFKIKALIEDEEVKGIILFRDKYIVAIHVNATERRMGFGTQLLDWHLQTYEEQRIHIAKSDSSTYAFLVVNGLRPIGSYNVMVNDQITPRDLLGRSTETSYPDDTHLLEVESDLATLSESLVVI